MISSNGWTTISRIVSIKSETFKYDPFGRRIEKISPATTSTFVYDGANLVQTVNSTGGLVAHYAQTMNIDEPLAMQRTGTTYYYEADGLGSITSLSSSAGALANTYTHDSFGNVTTSTGSVTNFLEYTGREFDTETGLYYYRARYYDPAAGRFLSEDPMRFAAGPDFYPYVNNRSINDTDPWGLAPSCSSKNCLPRSDLPLDVRLQLKLMSLASKLTGVTYYVGVQGSYTLSNGGFGASGGVGGGYATDPQGNEGLVYSVGGGATLGTPGGGGSLQIGAATYQNISGFSGNSFGQEAGGGLGLIVGGGYNTNSSGIFTYANVGIAAGKNLDYSPSTISNAVKIILICP